MTGIARYYLTAIVFAAGMFIATPAFLPSSFAMCMNAVVMGAVLNDNLPLGVFDRAINTVPQACSRRRSRRWSAGRSPASSACL